MATLTWLAYARSTIVTDVPPKERSPMSSTESDARTTSERFSQALRSATTEDHEAAAVSTYMTELFEGKLSRDEYAEMVAQHYFGYVVLEEAAEAMRGNPLAGPFVIDALTRVPALRADLEFLYGPDWESQVAPSASTIEYCERMRAVCFDRPEAFIAHHYTRYMGDLSGGQMIARVVRRTYGLDDGGADFYVFDGIEDIPAFKAHYRELLDQADLDEATAAAMTDEVAEAYRLNTAVLNELDADVTAARAAS